MSLIRKPCLKGLFPNWLALNLLILVFAVGVTSTGGVCQCIAVRTCASSIDKVKNAGYNCLPLICKASESHPRNSYDTDSEQSCCQKETDKTLASNYLSNQLSVFIFWVFLVGISIPFFDGYAAKFKTGVKKEIARQKHPIYILTQTFLC